MEELEYLTWKLRMLSSSTKITNPSIVQPTIPIKGPLFLEMKVEELQNGIFLKEINIKLPWSQIAVLEVSQWVIL